MTRARSIFLFPILCNSLSFNLPDFFGSLSPKQPLSISRTNSIQTQKSDILQAISSTNNGKDATPEQQCSILQLVRRLETTQPPPSDILTNPAEAQILNGTWLLQYTSPSEISDMPTSDDSTDTWKPNGDPTEGAANIEVRPFTARGSVSAAGVTVDTANRRVEQTLDIANQRVVNRVFTDWGVITVGGTFRVSTQVPNRAIVAFDTAQVQVGTSDGGISTTRRNTPILTFQLGFVFSIIAFLRQSKESGWLETTFVDDEVRLGRGNKGTMFVLTRDSQAVV